MRNVYFLFLVVLNLTSARAQNCYIQLGDYIGIEGVNTQLLDEAACILKDSLHNDSFKVFGMNYYLHDIVFNNYQELFQEGVNIAASQSEYYVFIGKISEPSGLFKDFWVDIKLPNTGELSCLDDILPTLKVGLDEKFKMLLSSNNRNDLASIAISEQKAINYLTKFVSKVRKCCEDNFTEPESCGTCLYTPDEILAYFNSNGYYQFNIGVPQVSRIQDFDCSLSFSIRNKVQNRSTAIIQSYIDYNIDLNGQNIDLENLIEDKLPSSGNENCNIYIMDMYNVNDNSLFQKINKIKSDGCGIMYFIFNYKDENYLFVSPSAIDIIIGNDEDIMNLLSNNPNESNDECKNCPQWVKEIVKPDGEVEDLSYTGVVVTTTLPLAKSPTSAGVVAAFVAAAVLADATLKRYITYILKKVDGGIEYQYCGITGGFGNDAVLLNNRLRTHKFADWAVTCDVDKEAYGIPWGYYVIRGREQQNIDYYGGSVSSRVRSDATCVNPIRGVRRDNPNGYLYHICSNHAFGEKHPYTGYKMEELESAINKAIKKFKDFFK